MCVGREKELVPEELKHGGGVHGTGAVSAVSSLKPGDSYSTFLVIYLE